MRHEDEKRKAEEKAKREREQLLSDYSRVFGTPEGKRVLWDLLVKTHVFSTTFTGNSTGFFKEGERNVGLYLLAMNEMDTAQGLDRIKGLKPEDDKR